MRLSFRRRSLLLAACGFACSGALAFAQESQPPADVPALPPTVIEAAPPTSTIPFDGEDSGLTGTILDGTMFSAPPAIGYRAAASTTGSIIAIPDADLPATVNSITRDVLDDQIALQISDVVRNAGGVTLAGDGLFPDRIFIRGMEVGTRNFRKDGFLDPTFVPRDFQNVERIEILKGPASVLYGSADPAGLVNIVTKKPMYDRFANVGFTFGAFQQSRFTLDANGIGTQSGNVLYRVNVAQEDAHSFVDFDSLNRTQIAPVVTWLMNDSTSITWNGEWHRDDRIGFQGTPAVNGDPLFLPPNRFVGEPANDFLNTEEFRQSLVLTHEINDDWTFNIGGYSLFYNFPNSTTAAAAVIPPTPIAIRTRSDVPFEDEQSQSMITNLAGDFCTGPLRHRAVVGMEYAYFDSASQFDSSLLLEPGFDTANPVYLNPPTFPLFSASFPVFRQQRVGGYVQDLIDLNDYWKVMGGIRVDTVDFNFERAIGPFPEVETQQTFNWTSPRGGIIYQPFADETLALYYSYSQSFTPPGGGIYLNGGLAPIIGESHEAGFKTELLPGLSLTGCGFHTTRQNDAFNVQSILLAQIGEVRSQGAEFNLVGSITERWSAIANYTYVDARLFDPDPLFDGNQARNVPYNTANFWTRYNFVQNECATAGAALGLVYLGDRPADLTNTLDLPAFSRWDAGLYYNRDQFRSAVYMENLFDLQYAASSINSNQIFQGAPFNVRATVGWIFYVSPVAGTKLGPGVTVPGASLLPASWVASAFAALRKRLRF